MNVEDAQMWPVGQPELAQRVSSKHGGPPIGCRCFDEAEVRILSERTPAVEYDELVADLEESARQECGWVVPSGNDYNCYLEDGPLAPNLTEPYPGEPESGECW